MKSAPLDSLFGGRHTWHMPGPKRPRDPVQLAKLIGDIATGQAEDTVSEKKRNPLQRGRAGGLKGGRARAKALPRRKLKAIAKRAAEIRWAAKHEPES